MQSNFSTIPKEYDFSTGKRGAVIEWSSIELEEIGLDLSGTEIELTEGKDYADQLNELPINP